MVLKITVECTSDGQVTFCDYRWPEDIIDSSMPCPVCGREADILNKELIPEWEEVKVNGKQISTKDTISDYSEAAGSPCDEKLTTLTDYGKRIRKTEKTP